ncbi:MAG: glycosyl hydrolase 2 galactose-binding domain-containing protein [Saccharofermentanales bacterium]
MLLTDHPSDPMSGKSLEEVERVRFEADSAPFSLKIETVDLSPVNIVHLPANEELLLDGEWQLAEEGTPQSRLSGEWEDSVKARVPGSVHTALFEAGLIPDPAVGVNQRIARKASYKSWWMKKTFLCPEDQRFEKLVFNGICNKCTIWLNGQELGSHEGMFGGPSYDVSGILRSVNTLVVFLEAIPYEPSDPNSTHSDIDNISWQKTVVFNNVYGWHYSNLPALGIWRSVIAYQIPQVCILNPFIRTKDASSGQMNLLLDFEGRSPAWSGMLKASVQPDNFDGASYSFEKKIMADSHHLAMNLEFAIPDHRLWWPNDMGDQNLYRMCLTFEPSEGIADHKEFIFGIRTVEMAPLPGGPMPDKYNWTFVVNGISQFVKGTGWCTMDPLMDFSRERYQRFISLAKLQHIQMMRAWGCGMPETDDFYDLCSRNGIMIIQEWPTTWNLHDKQPYDVLEETVRLNTLRIRNHAALVMWGAGNESSHPFGKAIDMMGRLSIELDGTRPFHTGEPWGGSIHNYDCYWGRKHFDFNLNLEAAFFGEFGIACLPDYESVQRYLQEEKDTWPPRTDGEFVYHSPIFGRADDLSRLKQYAHYFVPKDNTMKQFITGSQLSQATGLRHTLERARTRWPECSGALYYKLNDNFPAASWSSVDWYGAPKIGHYMCQDAFSPLHACVVFSTLNIAGTPASLPVFLLDDADALKDSAWKVIVRAFNSQLDEVKKVEYQGSGKNDAPMILGKLELTYEETDSAPLLIVTEVLKDGLLADRTFYWLNFEANKGCLFRLPETRLSMSIQEGAVVIKNTGRLPAVAVNVSRPGHQDTFTVSDNFFWLDPGEEKIVAVSQTVEIEVGAWNVHE